MPETSHSIIVRMILSVVGTGFSGCFGERHGLTASRALLLDFRAEEVRLGRR